MTKERALELGNLWEKGTMARVYFNGDSFLTALKEEMGLEYTTYKTGNMSSATLDGVKISNSQAKKMIPFKIYFDCNKNEIVID